MQIHYVEMRMSSSALVIQTLRFIVVGVVTVAILICIVRCVVLTEMSLHIRLRAEALITPGKRAFMGLRVVLS